jgi:hypothetical protein
LSNLITRAKAEDISQIVAFGFSSFAENNLIDVSNGEPDFNKAMISLTDMVMNELVFVKRSEDNPKILEGVLVLRGETTWWSDEPLLWTTLMYVKPEK